MSAAEWGVVAGGAVLIALINWYFFFSGGERGATPVAAGGVDRGARVGEDRS